MNGPYVCCDEAAAKIGCTRCDAKTGACASSELPSSPTPPPAPAKVTLEMSGSSVEAGARARLLTPYICPDFDYYKKVIFQKNTPTYLSKA